MQNSELEIIKEFQATKSRAERAGLEIEVCEIDYYTVIQGKYRIPLYSLKELASFVHGYSVSQESQDQ